MFGREPRPGAALRDAPLIVIVHTEAGDVLRFNHAFTETTGYRPEDLPDARAWLRKALRVPEAELNDWQARLRRRDAPLPEELTVHTAAGERRVWRLYPFEPLVPESERPVLVTVALDLTERREAERALRESEARTQLLALVVRNSPEFIGISDTEAVPVFVNEAGLDLVGMSWEEARATPVAEYFVPAERDFVRTTVLPAVLERGRWEGELHFRHVPTGEAVPVLYSVFRVDDPDSGEPVNFATITRDLTDQKRAEAALREANEALERRVRRRTREVRELAGKLTLAEASERSRLARLLHDDLQQQLYGVQFSLRDARKAAAGNTEALAALETAEALLLEAVGIARTTTANLSPPVLEGDGLAEALAWLGSDMRERHGLEVEVDVTGELGVPGEAVRVLLFSLVRELLFNVVKHAGVDAATVELREDARGLEITVSDAGRGFDPERLGGAHAGTGLGLSNVNRRLELFGGRLEIASAPGRGTRAAIFMPNASLGLE